MSTPWRLVVRHLRAHRARTVLTAAAVTVATFLLCFLVTIVTALDSAVTQSADNRLMVQSAVSLFVDLPRDYQAKIESVPGIARVSKFQWFGGYFRDPEDFFAQFAVDHDVFFEMYRKEIAIAEGPGGTTGPEAMAATVQAMAGERRAAIVGAGLARDFDWKVGDVVPITGVIFQRADGNAWDFVVVGVYEPLKANMDDRTMFFRWDYLAEALDGGLADGPEGVGVYSVELQPGVPAADVAPAIDALFANGPLVTWTETEAVFQAIFVAMLGNVPFFVGTVGGAVVFAVLFSVINTMLMASRQRVPETGILKALGFPDGSVGRLMLAESVALTLAGGALGAGLAVLLEEPMRQALGAFLPIYDVLPETVALAMGVSLVIGLVAGIAPALSMSRLKVIEALRSEV